MHRPFTRRSFAAFALLFLCGACPAQAPISVTQRQINEQAAALERARRAVAEDSGMRRPGEPLNGYLARLSVPSAHEAPAAYRKRIEGYLALFHRAAEATASARSVPTKLKDSSAGNRRTWETTSRALGFLPKRTETLSLAWRPLQSASAGAGPEDRKRFASELSETMHLVITGLDGLRDARP